MCGIVGLFNLSGEPASPALVQRMTSMLVHRGPDDEGAYTDGPIALGHRRLSIIDLTAAAHQPMRSRDGRFVIIFNGEIYNYQELRTELQAVGVVFNSRSDTEVLLNGYAVWGRGVLRRLNGMFAFAVWDNREKRLFIARDRFGIKPLYYTNIGHAFCFSSEIKAFLPHPEFSAALSREGLVEYFTFQNFFTDRTLFQGVHSLRPGHCMEIVLGGVGTVTTESDSYWDYQFEQPNRIGAIDEYVEELDRLFVQAVNRQLVSDVEIGAYLSGGMDSGSIAAVASRSLKRLKTFTVGFDLSSASGLELNFDERENAEHMSYVFGTEQYEMVLKAGDMERCMTQLAWHLEEPRVGQSYPNYYAADLASRFCKVTLAGTGGDEFFGGYPWRYYRALGNDDFDHYIDRYFDYWQRLLPNGYTAKFFSPVADVYQAVDARAIFRSVFASHAERVTEPWDYVNHSLYFEAKTFLPGLLTVEDKLSMAHGLETRVPFLDNDLVDFAMRLPVQVKLKRLDAVARINENAYGGKARLYFEQTQDGKLVLRRMMERYVPHSITTAAKQGFSAPDASWFKGESIEYVRNRLFSAKARLYEYLDRETVRSLVEDHLSGRENRRLLIWSLLNFEEWLNVFADGGWRGLVH